MERISSGCGRREFSCNRYALQEKAGAAIFMSTPLQ